MKRFLLACALALMALPALAQTTPPFEEKIDVNVVLLDVIVTDSRGNQILGLTKDDFVVKEDGVPQPVESLDYFTNRRLLTAREENAPFKVEQVREERYFVFFFDKPHDSVLFDQLTLARNSVRDFIREEMKEGDRVAIVGHDFRLKVYSDFTSDKKQLERALDESAKFGKGLERPSTDNGILQHIDRKEMIDHTGRVYDALRVLAESVRPIRARKNMVVFSPGIIGQGETITGGLVTSRDHRFDAALEALNASNVSVYPVQLQREVELTPYIHQRLEEMAKETGGQYYRFTNSFSPVLDRIEQTNNGYYLLTYRTRHDKGEKGFQKVDVSVKNREFRVTARAGYQYGG